VRAFLHLIVIVGVVGAASEVLSQESPTLDQLITKDQQVKLGVPSMRLDQREALRQALIGLFQRGYQTGKKDGYSLAARSSPQGGVVESQIDGDFEGWEGETIVKLVNGQIWQQVEFHYEYLYAFMPSVVIYPSAGGYKMKVEGSDQAVGVQRLR
jgi:hypothetical protein